jgi:hypothetical protein
VQIFGVVQFQTGAQENKKRPVALCASTSRRDAAPLGVRTRGPPEDTFARGRPPSQAAQLPRLPAPRDAHESAPRHAPVCHPRRAGRTRTARPSGPSAVSRPCASYYDRSVTLPSPQVEHAAYKRCCCLPAGEHRAAGRHCHPRTELVPPQVPRAVQPPFPLP